jgi:hypothetical protein
MKINKENYEDFLWRYLENDLRPVEKSEVEKYIRNNQEAAIEWELLKKSRLQPDKTIIFPNKQILFRKEENNIEGRKSIGIVKMMRYTSIAVAAALLAFGIILYSGKKQNTTETANTSSKLNEHAAPQHNIAGNSVGERIADNRLGSKKTTPGKIDLNKKGQKAIPGTHKEKNSGTQPKNEEKHPTILIVDQVKKDNPMAVISTKGSYEIDNNYDNGLKMLQPVSINDQLAISKQNSNSQADESKNLYDLFLDLRRKVTLMKKQENNKTYYALSIETNNIKINKTFKSFGTY